MCVCVYSQKQNVCVCMDVYQQRSNVCMLYICVYTLKEPGVKQTGTWGSKVSISGLT